MSDATELVKLRRNPGRRVNQDPGKIWRLRVAAGLSLTELAQRAGISKGHLSELEKPEPSRSASPAMLARLAAALDCDIADLMPGKRVA